MSINTFENKKLLWSTLQENNCFVGLADNTFSPVKQRFEDFVVENDNGRSSIVAKNKKVIRSMIQYLKQVKSEANTQAKTQANTQKPPQPIEERHKREDLQQERQTMFEDRLKKRQQEFTSLIEKNRPKEIDFSDKGKQSYNNIQQESERFIQEREMDLKTFPEKSNSETRKLNIDNSIVGNRTAKEATENIVIDINSEVETEKQGGQLKQDKKKQDKRVSFQDGNHIIDEEAEKDKPKLQKQKFNRLKSPPPSLSITTDSSDEDQKNNKQLSEILDFIKTMNGQLISIEKKYDALRNEMSDIKIRLDQSEIKNVCDDLIKTIETTKDIYD